MVSLFGISGLPDPGAPRQHIVSGAAAPEDSGAPADGLTISRQAQNAAVLFAQAAKSAELRQERIEQAQQRIEQGVYRINQVVALVAQRLGAFVG